MKPDAFPLPKLISKETVYENYLKIEKETLELPGGESYPYFVLELAPAAVMNLCFTPEGKLVVNREYRHPTKQVLISLPGGFIDKSEPPIEAAKRELAEETGFTAKDFKILGESFPFPGISNQKTIFVYSCEGKKKEEPTLETAEILQTTTASIEEIWDWVRQGRPLDGILLTGLQFLALNKSS